ASSSRRAQREVLPGGRECQARSRRTFRCRRRPPPSTKRRRGSYQSQFACLARPVAPDALLLWADSRTSWSLFPKMDGWLRDTKRLTRPHINHEQREKSDRITQPDVALALDVHIADHATTRQALTIIAPDASVVQRSAGRAATTSRQLPSPSRHS